METTIEVPLIQNILFDELRTAKVLDFSLETLIALIEKVKTQGTNSIIFGAPTST